MKLISPPATIVKLFKVKEFFKNCSIFFSSIFEIDSIVPLAGFAKAVQL